MKHSKSMVINLCYFEFMHRSQLRKEGNLLRNTDYFLGVHMRLELGLKNRTGMPPGTSTPSFCPLWVFIALILQNCSSPFFLMQWRTQRVRPSSEILRLTRRSTWKDWVPLSVHTNSFRKEITLVSLSLVPPLVPLCDEKASCVAWALLLGPWDARVLVALELPKARDWEFYK